MITSNVAAVGRITCNFKYNGSLNVDTLIKFLFYLNKKLKTFKNFKKVVGGCRAGVLNFMYINTFNTLIKFLSYFDKIKTLKT